MTKFLVLLKFLLYAHCKTFNRNTLYIDALPLINIKEATENPKILLNLVERMNILGFMKMSESAYNDEDDESIIKIGYGGDGLRAKIFEYDNTIVVAFKGTTPSIMGIKEGATSKKDKEFDQVMYSLCNTEECVIKKIQTFHQIGYFDTADEIIKSLKQKNPNKKIILTGHSLGGGIASLLAMKNDLNATVFSTPGDAYIAKLAGIYDPTKNYYNNILHIGMCNDSIFMGTCKGKYSVCDFFGYKVETRCHVGRVMCVEGKGDTNIVNHTLEVFENKMLSTEKVYITELDQKLCTEQNVFSALFFI